MLVLYFERLSPYVMLTTVVDDFGNEIALTDLADFWVAMHSAMLFVPFEHAAQLCGEH